jgi:uncharacterized protein YlxW (UPF0749 family)
VTAQPGTRRPDASMSLLLEAMSNPLDPGYALATQRRTPRSRRAATITLLLALGAGLLATVAAAHLRPDGGQMRTQRLQLEQEIERRTALADQRQRANQALRSQITRIQDRALAGGAESGLANQVQTLGLISGELPVTGPGLRYRIADAPTASAVGQDPREAADTDQGQVLDRDLQIVVNGLWAAGAEAVAINGERLTTLSAIRSAGQAILVDFRPLVPPYVVEAIGDPAHLQAGFADDMAGAYVQSLRDNYGIQVSVSTEKSLTLPGAGSLVLRSAHPVVTPPATDTPSAGSPSPRPSRTTPSPEATP